MKASLFTKFAISKEIQQLIEQLVDGVVSGVVKISMLHQVKSDKCKPGSIVPWGYIPGAVRFCVKLCKSSPAVVGEIILPPNYVAQNVFEELNLRGARRVHIPKTSPSMAILETPEGRQLFEILPTCTIATSAGNVRIRSQKLSVQGDYDFVESFIRELEGLGVVVRVGENMNGIGRGVWGFCGQKYAEVASSLN